MNLFRRLGLRGVIFDMDGLLFDTERLYLEAWPHVGEVMGLPITIDAAKATIARSRRQTEEIMRGLYGPDFSLKEAYQIMTSWLRAHMEAKGIPLKPGARTLLEFLRKEGLPVALGTSNHLHVANAYLEATAFAAYFDAIVAGDMVEQAKPAPDIFLRAAVELRLRPEQCLVLEDSNVGVEAAHRAGCLSLMVPDLLGPTEETLGRVWRVLGSLKEVEGTLF